MHRKKYEDKQQNNMQYFQYNRVFNSPKHYNNCPKDYNTYMNIQKIQKQQIKQPIQTLNQKIHTKEPINKQKSLSPNYSSVMVSQLIKQNDFLIDQVIKYKQTVKGYEKTIKKLQRSKSQKYSTTTLSSSDNIAIADYQNINNLNLNVVQSKIITGKMSRQSKNGFEKMKTQSRCKELLEQSLIYIKHSRNSISYEIQELNDKLCRLIQLSAIENNKQRKKSVRLEIADCVKELKQLRKQYQQLY